jgi:ubiquinone/menaquinone biosynthesis C-methylase UbiE
MKAYLTKNADTFGWGPANQLPEYRINELLPFVSGNNILDIGCGSGTFVDALTKRGFDAVGIDIVPKFINFARKNYQGKFLVADAYQLPFESKTFDTVFIRNVLEHLDNDLRALKEAIRVGKKIVIIVPHHTPDSLLTRGLIFSHFRDASHLRTYSPKSLKELISQTKATLIDIKFSECLPNKSVVYELLSGFVILKRIAIKTLFMFFKPTPYYLELIAIINS